jgi:hypothetical protein
VPLAEGMELKLPVSVGEDELAITVVGIELVVPVDDGVVFVLLLEGAVVPLFVGTELPESVWDDVPVPLIAGTELLETVGNDVPGLAAVGAELLESVREDVLVRLVVGTEPPESVGEDVPLPVVAETVGDDVPAVLAVGIELPETAGEDDVPISVGVVIELPKSVGEDDVPESVDVVIEFMVGDAVGEVLVMLLHRGATELIEVPEEVELNVSEEPWAQVAKKAKKRKTARHCSPHRLRINMIEILKGRISNDSYYKGGSSGKLNEMSSNE